MKLVTKFLSLAVLLMVLNTLTFAQTVNVTFEFDATALMNACNFDSGAGDKITLPGSFNGWDSNADELTATGTGNVYAVTKMLDAGTEYFYKLWSTKPTWENDPNRTLTPTTDANQTVTLGTFNKDITDLCGASGDIEVEFRVDMSVQRLGGEFNPATDIVVVAGSMNGWAAGGSPVDTLVADAINPDIYSKVIQLPGVALDVVSHEYKFVKGTAGGDISGWESVSNRQLEIPSTGLDDPDVNGFLNFQTELVYFNNLTPDQVFSQDATATIEVDVRPALYYLADNGMLPPDVQTSEAGDTMFNGIWVNGPLSGSPNTWETWGDNLAAQDAYKLYDDGTHGDTTAGDSVYTFQRMLTAGKARIQAGKFGINGDDNMALAGQDPIFEFPDMADSRIHYIFGLYNNSDGTLNDDANGDGNGGFYDPYIRIGIDGMSASVVRSSGNPDPMGVNVTFEFDATELIDTCNFDAGAGDKITLPGSFNGWDSNADELMATGTDNMYAVTLFLEAGMEYNFKMWSTGPMWENDPNRTFTPTVDANQTVDLGAFNKELSDLCGPTGNVEVEFRVDMSVQRGAGEFDPATDLVVIAGSLNGWAAGSTPADTLVADAINPDIYSKVIQFDNIALGVTAHEYKFVKGTAGSDISGWEGGDNKKLIIPVTGLSDPDANGYLNYQLDVVYFDGLTPDQVFSQETHAVFEVDLRPAFYLLADTGSLPADTQTGDTITSIDGLYINGPISGNPNGWETWGETLASQDAYKLYDDGNNGDAVAGDSVYTWMRTFQAGKPRIFAGKFGINGLDNEAGFGGDKVFRIPDSANPTMKLIFGAQGPDDNGRYNDDAGPTMQNPGNYDPYILLEYGNTVASVVRSGGEADGSTVSNENDTVPVEYSLSNNYPNPFNPTTTFEFTLPKAESVTIKVYDLQGRLVQTLLDGQFHAAGKYSVQFNASTLASGMYIYRLETPSRMLTNKMLLVK